MFILNNNNNNNEMPVLTQQTAVYSRNRQPRGIQNV